MSRGLRRDDEVYRELLPSPFPARSTVYVGLDPGPLVEIDALAHVDRPN